MPGQYEVLVRGEPAGRVSGRDAEDALKSARCTRPASEALLVTVRPVKMDLAAFRATGRDVDDLGAELSGMDLDGQPGRVYLGNGGVYIERWTDGRHGVAPPNGPTWLLTLGRDQYDGDLDTLEPLLFEWCVAEEIVA